MNTPPPPAADATHAGPTVARGPGVATVAADADIAPSSPSSPSDPSTRPATAAERALTATAAEPAPTADAANAARPATDVGTPRRSQARIPPAFFDDATLAFDRCWQLLERGARDRRSAFHQPAVATVGADGPEVRTVTLRSADRATWSVAFHADTRAGLVTQLLVDPRIGLHFYDAVEHTQLRLRGRARVHAGDALARERWGRASGPAHRCYFVPPPGTPATGPTSGLPPALAHRAPTAEESEAVFDRFAVVVVAVAELEWFQVHSVERRRARFRPAHGGWGMQWLTP